MDGIQALGCYFVAEEYGDAFKDRNLIPYSIHIFLLITMDRTINVTSVILNLPRGGSREFCL